MRRATFVAVGLLAVLPTAACEVTNPGPVHDEFLAEPGAEQALINGAVRAMSELIGYGTYTMALLGREIFPGGQTGAWGHDVATQGGHVLPGTYGERFEEAQRARFIAETAIKRFGSAGATDNIMYQAHLWAGYAYRVLGEWWCDAVVASTDPDDPEPGVFEEGTGTYFERAVANFTAALQYTATDEERYAALAGRAAALVWLDDWAGAAQDASSIPDDFVFMVPMDDTHEDYYNHLYEANRGQFRGYTIVFTWFEDYYAETGDPRTPWFTDPQYPIASASLQGFGAVPWSNQAIYTSRTDDMSLASGWEMRLIEAEAALQNGETDRAMQLIDHVRTRNVSDATGAPLEPWRATSLGEAWTFLKRERYIELWLEGRRLADERRWMTDGTPGSPDTPNWDDLTPLFTENPRSFCFDIPDEERDSNPNVPDIGS